MNLIQWVIAKIAQLVLGSRDEQRAASMNKDKEAGTYTGMSAAKDEIFEEKYYAATNMLKVRMNKKFPDNFHARLNSENNSPYDYGENRALAVDNISAAIAMALRNGATVREAAEAGAAKVGI